MPAINVYINDALKADMDSIPSESLNWSAICQAAITLEVARAKATTGGREAILSRLHQTGSKQFSAGYDVGGIFAREHADIDDFEAFSSFDDRVERLSHRALDTPAERLAFLEIAAELEIDDVSYFTGDGFDRRPPRWLRGFAQAMQEVWDSIKDQSPDL